MVSVVSVIDAYAKGLNRLDLAKAYEVCKKAATIQLGKGKTFRLVCYNYSPDNKYIQSVKLNEKEWNRSWFSHADLVAGGKMEIVMGKYPGRCSTFFRIASFY